MLLGGIAAHAFPVDHDHLRQLREAPFGRAVRQTSPQSDGDSAAQANSKADKGDPALEPIFVDYTYSASFRIPTAQGDKWKRKVDDNRLELVKDEQGEFKVIAGM